MAPVLQCPDCGEKHPLATVPTHGAFPCRGCGRVLKVPEGAPPRAAVPAAAMPSAAEAPAVAKPAAPVPTPVPVATAVARPTVSDAPAAVDPKATRVVPTVDGEALGALSPRSRRPVARLGHVPWWMRFLLWIIAVPLSFIVVFVIAREFSFFTSNQLSDLFLANNTARFWPLARLLPFVALVTATFVQVGVYLLARLLGRSRGVGPAGDLSGSVSRRPAR